MGVGELRAVCGLRAAGGLGGVGRLVSAKPAKKKVARYSGVFSAGVNFPPYDVFIWSLI